MARIERSPSIPQQGGVITEASTPPLEEIITEDGILCLIISRLTLREAVRTSVLSSRWRHLWTHIKNFHFTPFTVLDVHPLGSCQLYCKETYDLLKGKTHEFIQSVNSVLQQLQGARVYNFLVTYYLHKGHSQHIDAWVRFAVASKANFLELSLVSPYSNPPMELYEFPFHILGSSPIQRFTVSWCSLKLPTDFDGLRQLKYLCLGYVLISEEDFGHILSNCSSTLMKLGMWGTSRWRSISIPHPLSELLSVLVHNNLWSREIELNAVNLIELMYDGVPVDFKFRQSSRLACACICFNVDLSSVHNLDFYLTKLSSNLPHLRTLTLKLRGFSKVADLPKGSSRFKNLTRLGWRWNVGERMSILHLATLLDAAPFLKKMKLCLQLSKCVEDQPLETPSKMRELQLSKCVEDQPLETPSKMREMLPTHPHTQLKTIEISGFYFNTWQIEIVVYLLKNATELELMRIEKGKVPSWSVSEGRLKTGMEILSQDPASAKLKIR